MHLTFDWNSALRRSRHRVPPSGGPTTRLRQWKRFPFGDRVYRYGGSALESNWGRLHHGDREPFPGIDSLQALIRANPRLIPHVSDSGSLASRLEEAWRAYHAGDFADAVAQGLAAGPVGVMVATRAAAVYAAHVEDNDANRLDILRDAVESSELLLKLAPNWANAWYAHALALGRYSQNISVVKALTQGLGGKVRDCLQRAIQLEPGHADAHLAMGVYHAEVVDKVGAVVGALSYNARRDAVVEHFETARRLHPLSPVVLAEYAKARVLVFGASQFGSAYAMFQEAAACQPVDALERLDVEWALSEVE